MSDFLPKEGQVPTTCFPEYAEIPQLEHLSLTARLHPTFIYLIMSIHI